MASEELLKQFMSLMRQEKEKEKEEEERRREQEKEEKLKRKEEREEKLKREREEEEQRREQEKEEKLKRKEEKEEKLKREKEEEERRREQEKEEKLKRRKEKEEKLKREKEEEERRREREKEEKLRRREEKWAKMLSRIGVEAQGQHKDVDKRIKSLESEVIALQEEPSTAERARRSAEVERDDLAEEANSKASRVTMLQDDKRRLENAGSLLEGQAKAEGLAERAHRAQSSVDLLTTEVAAERASCGKLENAGSLLGGQAKAEGLAEGAHRAQSSVDLLTTEVAAERASCQKLENAGSLLEGQGKELRAKLQERETSQRARTKATIAGLESQTCQLEEQLEAESKELRAKLQERETSQRARTKATIAGLESQTCQLEEQLEAEGKELRAKLQERETSQRARTKATIAGLESQTCQLEEQLEAEGKERQALAKANRKLDKKVKEMSMQLEEQLEAEGKERQALAKANRKLDKKVEEMSMQLEEQLEAEGKERQALAKANRKLDKKVREMSMQLEDGHRQAEHYKGKDHDANEAKNMDEVHCTDLEVEENLDAEQGTESKVEGEIVDPKDWLKEGLVDRVDEIPPEGKGYWFPDRRVFGFDSRRVRVWRRRGERSNPAAIVERPTVRQRGIMVWGAIAYDSRSPLLRIQGTMTAQRYVDDVLRPVTFPYLQGVPNALYQQDNARPHTARISQQALQDVQMLLWPPYSPDLSPIEHVWDIIGRRLHALPQPRSEDELWQMVEREWRAIPQGAIRTLIDSLPRRVAACIAVRGGPTCY
ncbi:Transposase [Cordylochernes scorpioides]|uniref:Transposase n=1 Tax=Cordylochernes scorpioides TaxID=51811 RepID=A0ABY6KWZ0_9ARAC|nr:Transposase [Cordylochernes scorpioides]